MRNEISTSMKQMNWNMLTKRVRTYSAKQKKKAPRDAPDSLDRALHGAARNHRGMQFADTIKDPQKSSNPNRRIPLKSNNKTNTRRSKQRLKKPTPDRQRGKDTVCFIGAQNELQQQQEKTPLLDDGAGPNNNRFVRTEICGILFPDDFRHLSGAGFGVRGGQ